MIIAYEKNGSIYYNWGNRSNIFVVSNARLVSVSGNFIVYEQRGSIYKAEVDSNGNVCRTNIYVGRA